ncbi:iron-containing alcohol dehydrogenase [Butyricicoccus pullicaecorum]|uniref:iron-containing alcohol dehydrogenase n=1 Tax=Butyricicoccus pullicaecorum TaxID=501571 RepID=UPI0039906F64
MQNFTYCAPTKVIFGRGVESQIGTELRELGATRVLVHFGGGSVKKTGLLDKVIASLTEAGLSYVEFGGVEPNPKLSFIHKGIELGRAEKVDFILAVGGGSVIDSAKAIGVGLVTGNDPWQYASTGTHPERSEVFPVGVVLTISAAGSEMSNSDVITNDLITPWVKQGITSETVRPLVAFLNPENTFTVSKFQTGCGIVDIMMHTLERYVTGQDECDLSERIAEALLVSVREAGRVAIAHPDNYEARATLMWASSLSHNDLTGCGKIRKFPVHKLEHPVSALHDSISHGAGLSVLFPAWAQFVMKYDIPKFAQLANRVWDCPMDFDHPERTALAGIEAMKRYFTEIGMPTHMSELGLTPDEYDAIIDLTTKGGTRPVKSYIDLGPEEIRAIYALAE